LEGIRGEELSASYAVNGAADQTIFQTAELRLDETRQTIERAIEEHKPSRLVYDSPLEIRLITGDTPRFRRELIAFKSFLAKRNVVALLLDTQQSEGNNGEEVEGIAHGVIRFDKSLEDYGAVRRRIEVSKMRGVPVADGYHDMAIRDGEGVVVFPRIVAGAPVEVTKPELIKSGVATLDEMFGGGQ
jgi:circadian clock protein KaiC